MGSDPSRVRLAGPLAPYAEGFGVQLGRWGYAPGSVVFHLRLLAHLSRWLETQSLDCDGLTPGRADAFMAERRAAGYADAVTSRSLRPLLEYLRAIGVAPLPLRPEATTPVEMLLARYAGYLAAERGLAESTVVRNVGLVRPFLATQVRNGQLDLTQLAAGDVTVFVLARCRDGGGSVPRMVTALRSLLRFLHVDGVIDEPLAAAVPPAAGGKLAGLPKALEADQVTAMLASCDRGTVVGRRDLTGLL